MRYHTIVNGNCESKMLNERTISIMSVSRLRRTFEMRFLNETRAVVVVLVTVLTALLCLRLGEDFNDVIILLPLRLWLSMVVAVRFDVVATDKFALLFVVPMDGVAESLLSVCSDERGCIEENVGGIKNEFDSCFRSFSPLWLLKPMVGVVGAVGDIDITVAGKLPSARFRAETRLVGVMGVFGAL